MKKTMRVLAVAGAAMWILLGLAAVAYAAMIGESRNEVVECLTWQQQAKEYPGFYLLEWQREQCDAHRIWIGAPVK